MVFDKMWCFICIFFLICFWLVLYLWSNLNMLIIIVLSVSISSSVPSQSMWFNFISEVLLFSIPGGSGVVSVVDCTWLISRWCFVVLLLWFSACLFCYCELFLRGDWKKFKSFRYCSCFSITATQSIDFFLQKISLSKSSISRSDILK